jgi:hypothetical protein
MNILLKQLTDKLEEVILAIQMSGQDQDLYVQQSWNYPSLTMAQVSLRARQTINFINESNIETLDPIHSSNIQQCINSLIAFQAHTLTYILSGNGASVLQSYISLVDHIESIVDPIAGSLSIHNKEVMAERKKLEQLKITIEGLSSDTETFSDKIKFINEATATAENLPITLKQLNDAQSQAENNSIKTAEYKKIFLI